MGYYIDPEGMSKEQWLQANAISKYITIPTKEQFNHADTNDNCLVCLIDNGGFTAAAIAYCEDEFRVFANPNDRRPTLWFKVPIEKIVEVTPYVRNIGIFKKD